MTLEEKEINILNLYIENESLFDKCENLVFDEIWSTSILNLKYKIIKYYHSKGTKVDSLLVNTQLQKKGHGKNDILRIQGKPDHRLEKNIEIYMKEIFDAWCKRKLLPKLESSHSELSSEAGDVDVNIEEIKSVISDIEEIKHNLSKDVTIHEIYKETLEELLRDQDNKNPTTGYSWGIKRLDELTDGAKQCPILVIGPPAMGKSSLMVTMIKHIGFKQKAPIMVFSLEMSRKKLMKNILANILQINSYGIHGGKLSDDNLTKVKQFESMLSDSVFIDDTPGITWQYIEAKVKRMRKKVPIDKTIVVIIDYIQIMRNTPDETKGISEEQQQSIRANALQDLSKKYNLCLVQLSQMSRENIKTKKEPTMQDAKGSGAWESNAEMVWGLFRPEYFDPEATEVTDKGVISLKGIGKIIILKNRYGEIGTVLAKFKGHLSSFEDYIPDDNDIKQGEGDF